jgi:hypothetical protein
MAGIEKIAVIVSGRFKQEDIEAIRFKTRRQRGRVTWGLG